MAEVWSMGELLCEVMRPQVDMPLYKADVFYGPYPSGAAAIFIDTVARLGHSSGIVGGVGMDDFGKCLLDRLEADGVDCSQITQYSKGTTGVAFVTYFGDGTRRFLYHFPDTPATWSSAPDPSLLGDDIRYFHIMGCSLLAEEKFAQEIMKLMRQLMARGVKISFDPNIRPELMRGEDVWQMLQEVMRSCSVLLPGVAELLMISGKDTVEDAVSACFETSDIEIIALKKGSEGCTIYTRDESISFGVYPVNAKDPTGAGDCFDGAFLCGLIEGKNISEAAKMGAAAAALNTIVLGPMEGDISRITVEKMITSDTIK